MNAREETIQECVYDSSGIDTEVPTLTVADIQSKYVTSDRLSPTTSAKNLKLCEEGTFWRKSPSGAADCVPCPLGYYSSTQGSLECTSCGLQKTTLMRKSSSEDHCFCTAGYRIEKRLNVMSCVPCLENEWCIPGYNIRFWSIALLCLSNKSSHLCSTIYKKQRSEIQEKCLARHLCPTYQDVLLGSTNCIKPYTGVKCHHCISFYGKSLLEGVTGSCISCYWHLCYFLITFFLVSIVILYLSLKLPGHDCYQPSEHAIVLRIFLEHWNVVTVMRYLHIRWPRQIATLMQLLTVGLPLTEILSCLFMTDENLTKHSTYAALQLSIFVPIFYIMWIVILYYVRNKIPVVFSKKNKGLFLNSKSHEQSPHGSILSFISFLSSGFTFLYWILFSSFNNSLFYGLRCIKLESTQLFHAFVALDFLCDKSILWHQWAAVGAILYTWILPLCFLLILCKKASYWSFSRDGHFWSYFVHGYSSNTILWHSIIILRLIIIISVIGLSGTSTQKIVHTNFGYLQYHSQPLPESMSNVSSVTILCISIIYILVEVIRERVRISSYGVARRYLFFQRVSMLAIIFSFACAFLTTLPTSRLINLFPLPIEDQSKNIFPDLNLFFFNQFNSSHLVSLLLGIFALILHLVFVILAFVYMIRLILPNYLENLILHIAIKFYEPNTSGIKKLNELMLKESRKTFFEMYLLNFLVIRNTFEKSDYNRIPLSKIVNKEDILTFKSCLSSSSIPYEKAFAALLRLALERFSFINTEKKCVCFLKNHGFSSSYSMFHVKTFVSLQNEIMKRLESLSQETVKNLCDTVRSCTIIRYPILEDQSLALLYTENAGNQEESSEPTQDKELSLISLVKKVLGYCKLCPGFAKTLDHKDEKETKNFNKSLLLNNALDRRVVQELCQRLLQCLILDVAENDYRLTYNVETEIFLAQGVPSGTRNDGRTNEAVRNRLDEEHGGILEAYKENNNNGFKTFNNIKHRNVNGKGEQINIERNPQTNQKKYFEFFATSGLPQNDLRFIGNLIEKYTLFFKIFCDARPVFDHQNCQKYRATGPINMLSILRAQNILPSTINEKTTETQNLWLTLQNFFEKGIEKLYYSDKNNYASSEKSETASVMKSMSHESMEKNLTIPLLILTCIGGEFSIIPNDIEVFITEGVSFVLGPEGSLSGISIGHSEANKSENHSTPLYECIFLYPLLELSCLQHHNFLHGESDWTIECYIFFDDSFVLNEKKTESEAQIKTLCASSSGESIFSINLQTREMGMWNPSVTDPFQSIQPYKHIVQPPLIDDFTIPSWHFLTITCTCVAENVESLTSAPNVEIFFYINGSLIGVLPINRIIENIHVIGNNRFIDQPFGTFSNFCVWSKCFPAQYIKARYRSRHKLIKKRLTGISKGKKGKKEKKKNHKIVP